MIVAKQIFFLIIPHSCRKEKDKLKEIPKAGHRLALGMKLQKEVISNQKNSLAVKKDAASKKARVKKDMKSKVAAKKWQVNGKNFNNSNSDEFGAKSE